MANEGAFSAGEILVEQERSKPSVFCRDQRRNRKSCVPNGNEEELITVHTARQFMGDVGMLSGRRSLVRARMREGGEVVEVNRGCLQNLVQSDARPISEILMRAFIFRRVELIARGLGDVVLLGSRQFRWDIADQRVSFPQWTPILVC